MSLILPKPIAAYFAADRADADAVAQCFSERAIVVDERKTYSGRDAIRQWRAEAASKYTYVAEPFAITEENGETVLTSRLTGNFPGSPVDLRYAFVLEGDAIVRLEIAP